MRDRYYQALKNKIDAHLPTFEKIGEFHSKRIAHGSFVAAKLYKCSCLICRKSLGNFQKKVSDKINEHKAYFKNNNELPPSINHGKSGYVIGCRCDTCFGPKNKEYKLKSNQKYISTKKANFLNNGEIGSHGLPGYAVGCRCDICTSARKEINAKHYQKAIAYFKATGNFLSPKTKHGTRAGYKYGCRCELCKQSVKKYPIKKDI